MLDILKGTCIMDARLTNTPLAPNAKSNDDDGDPFPGTKRY